MGHQEAQPILEGVETSTAYRICPDVILRPAQEGDWILSNPRVHRHVQVSPATMAALMEISRGASEEAWTAALAHAEGRPRTCFAHAQGLMADPTGQGPATGPPLQGEELFKALRHAWIVEPSEGDAYERFLRPKDSLLDEWHLGTFHQAVGRYLLSQRVQEAWRWWHDQKFTPDGLELKPGLYRWIQGYFFKRYFGAMNLQGLRILDFACGNGYYSAQFQALGAQVLGVDTSAQLIQLARRNHGDRVEFVQPQGEAECQSFLEALAAASFDRIYLSDALLFFFYDMKSHRPRTRDLIRLLTSFRRLLKPSGLLYLMEPNGTFWLSSWLGGPPRPMVVVTEYRERVYHVAPTTDQVISALTDAGFLISAFVHPQVDPQAQALDPMAYAFAKAFPLWDFTCAVPDPRGATRDG